MTCFDVYIPETIATFFQANLDTLHNYLQANVLVKKMSGLNDFFHSQEEATELFEKLNDPADLVAEADRREYGDFQTNETLAYQNVQYVLSQNPNTGFELLIEPTCGKGNFILAALPQIDTLKKIVGIEIYQPYVWETKFRILAFFLQNPRLEKPDIDIVHANVFEYDFVALSNSTAHFHTLVIGNPPWVTNSELGSLDSKNLPQKSNFKKHSGLDAITGKGNFDIGESIALMILRNFHTHNGCFGFLIKNSVVKNLMYDQMRNQLRIGGSEKINIDSRKEFNVSVDACFFLTRLNREPEFTCLESDFYTRTRRTVFGWAKGHYVYSVSDYQAANDIEGESPFIWRQGVKHDCSKIMELERYNGHFKNGLNQEMEMEEDLVYGLLKSSDLKSEQTDSYRKSTIITQKKIGQNTDYIKEQYPLTYAYLKANKAYFDKRKSSIYNGKPDFSIFGIGDYSFMPYKVGVSGLYKSTHFTLVLPKNGKPIMLDDTCYFIGFRHLATAKIAHYLLNHDHTQQFLKAIIFPDSKRSITKEVLMRIDFQKLYHLFDFHLVKRDLDGITIQDWEAFGRLTQQKQEAEQMSLF